MMDSSEKPMFVPPRKRGSKSSSKSSNESLQKVGSNSSPQTPVNVDPRANRRLHQPLMPDQGKDKLNVKVHPRSHSPQRYESPDKHSMSYNSPCQTPDGLDYPHSDASDYGGNTTDDGGMDADFATERSALNSRSVSSIGSCDKSLTMMGTIKRGKKKGQTMGMKVQMSREELDELEHSIMSHQTEDDVTSYISSRKGPHIALLTVILLPIVLILACCYSFYMGTMTWYNMLVFFSEHKRLPYKIFISPLLIVLYPFLITLGTAGLGLYAAFIQLSWHYDRWKLEIQDLEKGFYGWLCCTLALEDCSPYEVVILTEVLPSNENEKSQISDTAL